MMTGPDVPPRAGQLRSTRWAICASQHPSVLVAEATGSLASKTTMDGPGTIIRAELDARPADQRGASSSKRGDRVTTELVGIPGMDGGLVARLPRHLGHDSR